MKRGDGDHYWEVEGYNIYVWDVYWIQSFLLDSEAISDGFEMDPDKINEIIEEYSDLIDKRDSSNIKA